MNQRVEVTLNTSETRKGMQLRSEKRLHYLPTKNVTGDNNSRRIHIPNLRQVQDEREGKYQECQINLVHVVHDTEIFFNDEIINCNLLHLPRLSEVQPQELNEKNYFS